MSNFWQRFFVCGLSERWPRGLCNNSHAFLLPAGGYHVSRTIDGLQPCRSASEKGLPAVERQVRYRQIEEASESFQIKLVTVEQHDGEVMSDVHPWLRWLSNT